jgi:alpha-beta hydrolase superfamily lysophospholipase
MHSGADDYLPVYAGLIRRGYSVITYDGTGTYGSEGEWTVGTCRAAQDLFALLDYIFASGERTDKPILLMGHSLGAYAAAVAAPRFAVQGCVCISGMDLASSLIMHMAQKYVGIAAQINRPLLAIYQRRLFGKLVHTSAVGAINSATCPVLIAHGECDEVINASCGSLISNRYRITNPLAEFYVGRGKCGTHSGILFSAAANDMREELFCFVKANRDKSENELCRILSSRACIDHFRPICEVNEELMEKMPKLLR